MKMNTENLTDDEFELLIHIIHEEITGGDVTTDTLFELDGTSLSNLLVRSYVRYGPNDTIELTESGEELVSQKLKIADILDEDEQYVHIDDATYWLVSSLILGEALKTLLAEGDSITVDIDNLLSTPIYLDEDGNAVKKINVSHKDGTIGITPGNEDD